MSLNNENKGITIANFGLNEYEVLQDGSNTIAVTLLRAVGEMGDWGAFPTPEAQCLGENTTEFEIILHENDVVKSGAFVEAYQFQVPWNYCQTDIHEGVLPASKSFISWSGETLALTGVKCNEDSSDIVLRWNNMSLEPCSLVLNGNGDDCIYRSNVVEDKLSILDKNIKGEYSIEVKGAEIITLRI